MKIKKALLILFSFGLIFALTYFTGAESTLSPEEAFTQANGFYEKGEYETAIDGFRRYLAGCADQPDAENAYYWVGECYYSQEKYNEAVTEYRHLVTTYPNSANLGRAIYKLARCQQELGNTSDARELFQRLVDDYGGTLEADQAAERLKDL